jgi:hypothetical protein
MTETGRIVSHGNLFDGGFYITEEGMQALEDMERSQAKPQWIAKRRVSMEKWDVFISHATEDQEQVARPLAEALQREGLKVWYAEFSLTLGDSLRRSIDRGLAGSRYGVVILSPSFFQKEWSQKELDALVSREVDGEKRILPVWHQVERDDVARFSPMLADRFGISTDKGIPAIVTEILRAMEPKASSPPPTPRLAVPSPERLESPTVTLSYEEMYISQHIHKYRLVAKFTNTFPEAQDGFRFEVFLPARVPKESNGFHFEKDVQIDHELYSPAVYESSQRVFPGQPIEICGKETEVYLEYQMNYNVYWDLSSRPVQVLWKMYLQKASVMEGKVPFKDLHCF